MPIRLTWTLPPSQNPEEILGFKLYKRIFPGPITIEDFFHLIGGTTFLYDDNEYNESVLEGPGYLYRITALTSGRETGFSNEVRIQSSEFPAVHVGGGDGYLFIELEGFAADGSWSNYLLTSSTARAVNIPGNMFYYWSPVF